MEITTCKYDKCSSDFEKKRGNQRYCCKPHRILANNQKALANYRKRCFVEKPMKKNFVVLESLGLNSNEEIIKHKEWLTGSGYNHKIISHYATFQNKSYPAIYYYILIYQDNNQVKIIKYD